MQIDPNRQSNISLQLINRLITFQIFQKNYKKDIYISKTLVNRLIKNMEI